MSKKDVVIIGEDLSGIATACLLQRHGVSTCIVRHKDDLWTQYNNSNTYYWDCSVGALSKFFKDLEIEYPPFFQKKNYVDYIYIDGKRIVRPFGWRNYQKILSEAFPEQKDELNIFFETMQSIANEWQRILETGSIFGAGRLENMIKYRDVSYLEYLELMICNEGLRKILSIDCVKDNAALPVIAGYVVTQIFDGYFVDCIEELTLFLKERYMQMGGHWLGAEPVKKISRESSGYLVELSNSFEIKTGTVVSSYGLSLTKELYNIGLALENKYSRHDRVRCYMAEGTLLYNSECHLRIKAFLNYQKAQYKTLVSLFKSPKANSAIIRFDVPIEEAERLNLAKNLSKVVRQDPLLRSYVKDAVMIYPGANKITNGMHTDFLGWEFTCTEIKGNVMAQDTAQDGIYTLGQWGDAWFTAALVVAKSIIKVRQVKNVIRE